MCHVLGVPRSSFYARRATKRPVSADRQRKRWEVERIHRQSDKSYGKRRMSIELRTRGFDVGVHQARSLMREAGVVAQMPRPPIYPKHHGKLSTMASNVLDRQFNVNQPRTIFAGDITYIWTQQGWLYLAVVLDLYGRRVAGWAFSDQPDSQLTVRALRLAVGTTKRSAGRIFHSDQGCQYTSRLFVEALQHLGLRQSMSRRGNCWDNAVVERFFGSLKCERVRQRIYRTRTEAQHDITDYIVRFYNAVRIHSANGGLSPDQFQKRKIA